MIVMVVVVVLYSEIFIRLLIIVYAKQHKEGSKHVIFSQKSYSWDSLLTWRA